MEKLSVFVVDDQKENIELLHEILASDNYNVLSTTDSTEAFALIKASLPDIILLDVSMPEMDGFTLCRKIKSYSLTASIPVLFISAYYTDRTHIIEAFQCGACDYITKPFMIQELLARLNNLRKTIINEKILKKQSDRIEQELEIAANLMNLFNKQSWDIDLIDYKMMTQPHYQIGGDFFDIHYNEKAHVVSCILGDVSGHGIASALLAAIAKTTFHNHIQKNISPAEFFNIMNSELFNLLEQKWYITAFMCTIDFTTNTITYCGAGHPPVFHFKSDHHSAMLKSNHVPVFMLPKKSKYTNAHTSFSPGDFLFMYTDGTYEIRNEQDQVLGIKPMYFHFKENLYKHSMDHCMTLFRNKILNHAAAIKDDYMFALFRLKGDKKLLKR